jgi:PKD repeat protein
VDPNGTNVINDLASNIVSGTLTLPSPSGLGSLSVDTVAPTLTLTTSGTIAITDSIELKSTEDGVAYFTTSNTYATYDELVALSDLVTSTLSPILLQVLQPLI